MYKQQTTVPVLSGATKALIDCVTVPNAGARYMVSFSIVNNGSVDAYTKLTAEAGPTAALFAADGVSRSIGPMEYGDDLPDLVVPAGGDCLVTPWLWSPR